MPQISSVTYLTAAAAASDKVVQLNSGTNVAQGTIFIIDGEAFQVQSTSAPFSTTIPSVNRGQFGTRVQTHILGAKVGVVTGATGPASNAVPPPSLGPSQAIKSVFTTPNDTGPWRFFAQGSMQNSAATGYGNSTTIANNTTYCIDVLVPRSATITGVGFLAGNNTGQGNFVGILFDKDGNVLAQTASTATGNGGNNVQAYFQAAFTSPYFALGPAQYFIGFQGNNNNDTLMLLGANNASYETTFKVNGGTFNSVVAVTPPQPGNGNNAFTAAAGALGYLY